jgi:hypothetical protein
MVSTQSRLPKQSSAKVATRPTTFHADKEDHEHKEHKDEERPEKQLVSCHISSWIVLASNLKKILPAGTDSIDSVVPAAFLLSLAVAINAFAVAAN